MNVQVVMLVSTFSILAPAIAGAIFYSRLLTVLRILYFFILTTLALEIITRILFEYGMNNLFLFHAYSFIEFSIIALIYYRLSPNKLWRKLILRIFILFQTYSMVSLLFFENVSRFNSIQRYTEMGLLSILFLTYLLIRKRELAGLPLHKDPLIVLTAAWLIYFGGTLYLFIYGNEVLEQDNRYWIIHGIFNIFLNISYTFVLWLGRVRLS